MTIKVNNLIIYTKNFSNNIYFIFKNIINKISKIFYNLSIFLGFDNIIKVKKFNDINKEIEKLNKEIINFDNDVWYHTGHQFKISCLQIEKKYGISNE